VSDTFPAVCQNWVCCGDCQLQVTFKVLPRATVSAHFLMPPVSHTGSGYHPRSAEIRLTPALFMILIESIRDRRSQSVDWIWTPPCGLPPLRGPYWCPTITPLVQELSSSPNTRCHRSPTHGTGAGSGPWSSRVRSIIDRSTIHYQWTLNGSGELKRVALLADRGWGAAARA